jgi:AraC-like DNA-binding protein
MDDLAFLSGAHMPRCTAVVDKHFHGYCTLQLMTRGSVDLFYERQHQRLDGRWFWSAFPGPWTRFRCANGSGWWDHRYIAVRGPLAMRWLAEGLIHKGAQPVPDDRKFEQEFDAMLALMLRPDHWGHRRALNLLEQLLLMLADLRATESTRQPWLEQVLARIAQPEPYSVDALARELGMAASTLRRRFRHATGTALHTHALACRIGNARQLLAVGDLPVKDIAERLGYSDVSFFTKQFKQLVGMPPAAYRRSRQLPITV